MESILQNQMERIMAQKELKVIEAFSKLLGGNFSMEEESKRMFPRIKIVSSDIYNKEVYYWDNGTAEGLKVISFTLETKFDFNKMESSTVINYEIHI